MKACAYIRVSTDMQAESGLSLAYQKEKIMAYCAAMDIELVAIFEDAGKSGKEMATREELQKALVMLKRKKVDALVVLKIDRLTRSLSDLAATISTIEKWGATLISIQESINSSMATGRLLVNLIGAIAAFEVDSTSERTRQSMSVLKSRCQRYSRHTPYGWNLSADGKNLTEDNDEKLIVDMMRDMRYSGMTYQSISEQLNNKNVNTKNGAKWHATTVRNIIIKY